MSTLRMLLACGSPQTGRVVLECLQLRGFAIALMRGARDDVIETALQRATRCSILSWRTFLHTERCALWLHDELQRRNLIGSLPPGPADAVSDMRRHELRRVLLAQAQLRDIATLATKDHFKLIVLKGGLAAIRGRPLVALFDIDILPGEGEAECFAERLDQSGYSPNDAVGRVDEHLLPRRGPNLLDVEIHRFVKEIEPALLRRMQLRAQPIESWAGLWRLAPMDHLWHLLVHVGLRHLDRQGAIRDQLLIRSAAAECTEPERDVLRRRIHRHAAATTLNAVLDAAINPPTSFESSDPFLLNAAARYAAATAIFTHGKLPPAWVWNPLRNLVIELAVDRSAYRRRFRRIAVPAPIVAERLLPRVLPAYARQSALVLLRTLRLLALTPPAALLALRSAHIARQYRTN